MHFHSTLVSSLLFTFSVLADRHLEHQQYHHLQDHTGQFTNAAFGEVRYSTNWAGALWDKDNRTFNAVTGTFTVPVPSGPSGAAAAVWVGIDGYSCHGGGLLQAGVEFTVTDNGTSYYGWCEWYPDHSYYFQNLTVSAGDIIKLSVSAPSMTSGVAMVENQSNGQSGTMQLSSTYALCGKNAEWIVEDFEDGLDDQVPFANFGSVTFSNAMATGSGTYTPDGAIIVDLQRNNQTMTSVSTKGSSVTINYV